MIPARGGEASDVLHITCVELAAASAAAPPSNNNSMAATVRATAGLASLYARLYESNSGHGSSNSGSGSGRHDGGTAASDSEREWRLESVWL